MGLGGGVAQPGYGRVGGDMKGHAAPQGGGLGGYVPAMPALPNMSNMHMPSMPNVRAALPKMGKRSHKD